MELRFSKATLSRISTVGQSKLVDDNIGRVGFYECGVFVEVTVEWSIFFKIVGRDGVVFDW
jgi:hypothetical protein